MKKIIFILFVFLSTLYQTQIVAQETPTPSWTWAKNINGQPAVAAGDDGAFCTDNAGNSYVVHPENSKINIRKYDATGALVFSRTGSVGSGTETATDIAVDTAGNYYVTGYYTASVTFGSFALTNSGQTDIFVVKYNPSGTVLWAQKYGDTQAQVANSIAVDKAGNCYVGGYISDSSFYSYFFYAKYNASGVEQWTKLDRFQGSSISANRVKSISVDNFGNMYMTGSYSVSNSIRAVILKCDPSGNKVWEKTRTEVSEGNDIVTDGVGNSYVTGTMYSSTTNYDIFTTKYDAAGRVVWSKTTGGPDKDYGDGIAIDANENCYISGRFQSNATFGPIAIENLNSGVSDLFVAKYDNLGDIVWVQQAGESGEDAASKIGVDGAGNCYINGFYTTSATFGAAVLNGLTRQPLLAKIGNFVEGTEAITTLPLASRNYNAGGAVSVPFTTKGTFPAGTTFTVELSDPSGSFFYPKYIGVGLTSPISCVLPSLTIPASDYRIRVICANPAVLGTDNGSAITINGNSQLTTPDWAWAKNIDGVPATTFLDAGSISTDTAGNSYIVNQVSNKVNIKKYDAAGTLVWNRIGSSGSGIEKPMDITVDADGNYYITGSYTGSATFGSATLTNAGQSDIFVVKYNASGTVVWAQKYGDTSSQQANSIAVDSSGNCYLGGYTTYVNTSYIFYAKYNPSGVVLWTKTGVGSNTTLGTATLLIRNEVKAISIDSFGNTYLTGSIISSNTSYAFITKCDPSGNTVWQKQRTEFSVGNDIVTDSVGNSYVTGAYYDNSQWNIFTTKYNAAGVVVWTQNGIGLDNDYGDGIALDAQGNCFVTGRFQHNTDFSTLNISNTSSGVSDVFVAKYDNKGSIVWLQQAGESGQDAGSKIGVDAVGNCYINGYYSTNATFGNTTLNGVNFNPFLAKIGLTADTTLGTAVVKGENLCGGAVVTVDFAITGKYDDANVFTAQLSNASGSFSSPVNIGTLESPLNTSIYAIIPLNTPAGTGYRIRVISSNLALIGNDNGINIRINQADCKNNVVKLAESPIAAIEYFIDTDPGVGKGIALTTTGGLNVTESFKIVLPTLTAGFHNLFIRTKNADGIWGMYEGRVIYVQPTTSVLSSAAVASAEYFFDTDPGVGLGKKFPSFTSGNPVNLNVQADVTGLTTGFHNLFIRTKDANGKWSMYDGRVFYVQPQTVALSTAPVVAAEYFFDTDPGIGNGTALASFTQNGIVSLTRQVSVAGQTSGFHNLFIRTKDANGKWGMYEGRVVYIQPPIASTIAEPIIAAEYFLNTDPGIGLGTIINTGVETNELTLNIPSIATSPLQTGTHNVFIRVKNKAGKWGLAERRTFSICTNILASPVVTGSSTLCPGSQLNLTASDVVGATSYKWTGPNNYTATGKSITINSVSATNAGVYTVVASNGATTCGDGNPTKTTVIVGTTAAPTGLETQTFVSGTLTNILLSGSGIKWYASASDASTRTNVLPNTTVLVNNTTYYATQTVNGCESTSSLAVTVTVSLGVNEFDSKVFTYYPNPVENELNLSYSYGLTAVKVFDNLGRQVYFKKLNEDSVKVDMSSMVRGVYFVEVTSKDSSKTIRVIKK